MNSKKTLTTKSVFWSSTGFATLVASAGMLLASSARSSATTYEFQVPGTSPWFDTGLDLSAGCTLTITASGSVYSGFDAGHYTDPNGLGPLFPTVRRDDGTVIPETIGLSLIGKIGGAADIGTGTPVPEGLVGAGAGFVGSSYSEVMTTSGRLFLGFNDGTTSFGDNSGSYTVDVTVTPVPEPSALALCGLGAGVWALSRRKTKSAK